MIEVWINTNEKANDDPSEHFYIVGVAITPFKTVQFDCGTGEMAKDTAIKLKQAIADVDSIELN